MSTAVTSTTMAPPARARRYTGAALKEIAFPLGGIGTGTVSLGGSGQLRDWEIFNRPAKGRDLALCFFSLWAKPEGAPAVARVLESRRLPPFVADRGLSPWAVAGLPRLDEATFTGSYPIAQLAFHDAALPVEVELEAFSPFAPPDDRVSGMPVAVFLWRVRNPGGARVDLTLAYTQLNPVGYDGLEILRRGRRHAMFGGNLNQWTDEGSLRGLRMSRPELDGGHPGAGTLAVATPWRDVTFSEHWQRAGWFDDIQSFWDDFRDDGRLPDRAEGTLSPTGETDAGTLGLIARLRPGETVELPVVLAWHFPNLVNYWGPFETLPGQSVVGQKLTNWFATQWPDAWAVARETIERLDELTTRTRRFRDALFASTLAGGGDRRRLQPDVDHPDHDLSPHRRRALPRVRGLRRHRRLLPDELHARVELRPGARVPVPPARAHRAPRRLPVQHPAHRRAEVPHHAAAGPGRPLELRGGGRRPDGHPDEALPRVARLRRRRLPARALAAGARRHSRSPGGCGIRTRTA